MIVCPSRRCFYIVYPFLIGAERVEEFVCSKNDEQPMVFESFGFKTMPVFDWAQPGMVKNLKNKLFKRLLFPI